MSVHDQLTHGAELSADESSGAASRPASLRPALKLVWLLLMGLAVGCSAPECESAPGLAASLSRLGGDRARIAATATELAEATANAQTSEGEVLHQRATSLAELATGDNEMAFSGALHATVLAGENLAGKCH